MPRGTDGNLSGDGRSNAAAMREKQWTRKYPELGTGPVPAEPMFSEEHFAL